MLATLRSHLTFANVMSCFAVFMVLGGGAYAATTKSAPSAHSAKKTKAKRGPRGKRGRRGFKGAKGDRGATGATGSRGATGLRGASGVAGSARGYAYVRADGTLAATRTKGVVDNSTTCFGAGCSAAHGVGRQCFNLSFTPKNVVATAESVNDFATASLDPSVPGGTPGCPDGYRDATAVTVDATSHTQSNGAFYIAFN